MAIPTREAVAEALAPYCGPDLTGDLVAAVLALFDQQPEPLPDVDITNYQMVGVQADRIVVSAPRSILTHDEALVQAAWLSALADPLGDRAEAIRRMVAGT